MKNRLMYMLGVLIPSISFVALFGMVVWLAYDFGFHEIAEVNIPFAALKVVIIIVCIILIRIFDPIRREYRQRTHTGIRERALYSLST